MADSTDYNKWLDRASQDIKMVDIIKSEGLEGMEDSFCYICHQATEKLLKSLLIMTLFSCLASVGKSMDCYRGLKIK